MNATLTDKERKQLEHTRDLFTLAVKLNPKDTESQEILAQTELRLNLGSMPAEGGIRDPAHMHIEVTVAGEWSARDIHEVSKVLKRRARDGEDTGVYSVEGRKITFRVPRRYPLDREPSRRALWTGIIIGALGMRDLRVVGFAQSE